ncbi:TSC22 domain family protein 2 isoform X3, partial [Clarias magur]
FFGSQCCGHRQQNRTSNGSSEESFDVCCSRGSGGAERADQRTDRKKLSARAGKQPAEEFSQSGAV